MLVLSRKLKEALVIGDNIRITILDVEGDQIKLGIDAPREVRVYRQEIFDAIQEANRMAAQVDPMKLADLPNKIEKKKGKVEKSP
ncbi:MAG: carbon storage regulator CsrA [Firmicutes bacterium]|nr:carbon storage regulator CsrA [Bacillota bacterium]